MEIGALMKRTETFSILFLFSGVGLAVATAFWFHGFYRILQDRIEWPGYSHVVSHMAYLFAAFAICGPLVTVALGLATWIAAIKTLCCRDFFYEVANKPKPEANK